MSVPNPADEILKIHGSKMAKPINFTEGAIGRKIFIFAIPMLIGNVMQQFYNMVDSWVVGNYVGKNALAAVSVGFPVLFVMIALSMGLSIGSSIIISQYFGARNIKNIRVAVGSTYAFAFAASIILTLVGIFFAEPILRMIATPAEALVMAKSYLQILFGGLIFTFGYNIAAAILRAVGDTRTPLYFLIITTVMNIILDLVFVVGFGWGISGAAWATVISQAFSLILCLLYMQHTSPLLALTKKNFIFERVMLGRVLKIGIPSGVQQAIIGMSMFFTQWIVNGYGTDVMAGYGLGNRVDSICFAVFLTMGMAISTYVGQNVGAQKLDRVYRGVKITARAMVVTGLILSVVIIISRHFLLSIFVKQMPGVDAEAVVEAGARMIFVEGLFYFVFAVFQTYVNTLRGVGAAMQSMLITLFTQCLVRVPLAYFLSQYALHSVDGVWLSFGISWIVAFTLSYIYYRSGRWQNKALIKAKAY